VRTAERERVRNALDRAGIQTLIDYPIALHRQQAIAGTVLAPNACPFLERLADGVLSLPIGPLLRSEHVERVIVALRRTVGAPA